MSSRRRIGVGRPVPSPYARRYNGTGYSREPRVTWLEQGGGYLEPSPYASRGYGVRYGRVSASAARGFRPRYNRVPTYVRSDRRRSQATTRALRGRGVGRGHWRNVGSRGRDSSRSISLSVAAQSRGGAYRRPQRRRWSARGARGARPLARTERTSGGEYGQAQALIRRGRGLNSRLPWTHAESRHDNVREQAHGHIGGVRVEGLIWAHQYGEWFRRAAQVLEDLRPEAVREIEESGRQHVDAGRST
jgi:hypothetical protein